MNVFVMVALAAGAFAILGTIALCRMSAWADKNVPTPTRDDLAEAG